MTRRSSAGGQWIPTLPAGVALYQDQASRCWTVSVPARTFMPDDVAVEVLRRCDGRTSVDAMADDLAQVFSAEPESVRDDILDILDDLAAKGAIDP